MSLINPKFNLFIDLPIKIVMVQELKKLANIAESERNLLVRYFVALGKHQHNLLGNCDDDPIAINDEIAHISRIALSLKDYKLDAVDQLIANGESIKPDTQITMLLDSIRDSEINDFDNIKNTISETMGRIDKYKSRNEDLINQSLNILKQINPGDLERFPGCGLNRNDENLDLKDQEGSSC